MYAAKLIIDRNPQKIRYSREIELPDGLLTLSDISKHLKDGEMFNFQERETSMIGSNIFMLISGDRDETPEELAARIVRQEKYNEGYDRHHAKYNNK